MAKCYIRWTDKSGEVHETDRFDNLLVALRASWKDAEKLGLEMAKADGIEIRDIVEFQE
jgi:hypothetical protein